ncbi:hypothetical protein JG687_00004463 [Phytophthora cactorum]|uniref:Uncharacterized protein n=1 Tax=Phytophthora cactorum TaxID=29920 RepID=A0A8T1UR53_9STRA|nr:hypothetical protein JG687_00004463 [Phytophthora cactorum]
MTRFTMSDTTPSAKNVADHLGTEQGDYTMYLLNLCIGYGIGLKDNIQTSSYAAIASKDSSSVRSSLTANNWMLAAEMEATTLNIANLALVDAQNQNLVSSDMVVFRRPAEKNLKFQQMAIEAQSSKEGNETTHRRVQRMRDQFSDPGNTCLKRTLLQLQARFPKVTRESMAYLLLDPRMKHAAKTIATVGNVPLTKEGEIPLSLDFGSQSCSIFSQETSPFLSPASNGWDDEDELLLEAPLRLNQTHEEVKDARTDKVLLEWLELEPDWLEVASHLNPKKTKDKLKMDMSIDKEKGTYWSLLRAVVQLSLLFGRLRTIRSALGRSTTLLLSTVRRHHEVRIGAGPNIQ